MVTVKTRTKSTQVPAFELSEYVDPTGSQLPPWGQPFILSRQFVEKTGIDPKALMFYQQPDPSMYHRLKPGDIAIIDTSDQVVRDGCKYLIQHSSGAKIRWVFVRQDGGLTLTPDSSSQRFRPEEVTPEVAGTLRIIGKVVLVISFVG